MHADLVRDNVDYRWQLLASLGTRLNADGDAAACVKTVETILKQLWPIRSVRFVPGWNLPRHGVRPEWSRQRILAEPAPLYGRGAVVGTLEGGLTDADVVMLPLARGTRAVGLVQIEFESGASVEAVDLAMLASLQAQWVMALDALNARLEVRYKEAYGRALGDFDFLIASYDVKEILKHSVRQIHDTVSAEQTWVVMCGGDPTNLALEAVVGVAPTDAWRSTEQGQAILRCLELRRSVVVGSETEASVQEDARRAWHGALTPIMANRKLYGVLAVFRAAEDRLFHRNDVTFVNQVALKLSLVLQNAEAYLTINSLNEVLEQRVKERTAELEQALRSLQETQAQLVQTEKLATIGTLAGGVAHELNNPLSAILANVQLLRMDIDDPELCDQLALVEAGAQRCKRIVVNLLNFARQPSPEYRPIALTAVLHDTLELLSHRLKHMSVVRELTLVELPHVMGTLTELGQVLTNLIVNAMDAIQARFGDEAGGVLRILTAFEAGMVQVDIVDNGEGVPDAILSKIFDPFFTTKQVGKGTGLGLSVSQQIVRKFGGSLEVFSERGAGATFRLRLPPSAPDVTGVGMTKGGRGGQDGPRS